MPKPQVAVVIGAGDATGGAIARRFAREDFTLVVTRRQQADLQPLVDEIHAAGGVAHPFGCDARQESQMVELFEHIAEQYWQLHCQPRDSWTHELDLRPWMETF